MLQIFDRLFVGVLTVEKPYRPQLFQLAEAAEIVGRGACQAQSVQAAQPLDPRPVVVDLSSCV